MTYRLHGILIAIALALSAGVAQAQEATGDLVPYVDTQLVGFTSTTVTGWAGVLGMLNACHIEFPASRMCTSEEVMNTVAMPVLPAGGYAWVRPSQGLDSGANDLSGQWVNDHGGGTCQGWTRPDLYGFIMDVNGRFHIQTCSQEAFVACCARIIVVPEPSASLQLGTGILGLAALSGRAVCGS